VTDAISAGDKRCATCHPSGGTHTTSHESALGRPDCLECHKSNIAEEHENNCDKCHQSTDPVVIAAISAGRGDCGACHTPGLHAAGFFSNKTDYYAWTTTPGPRNTGTPLGEVGANPTNPGVHANYQATTAKCGICHSVHRANAAGTKLMRTGDASCAGCHTTGTTVTTKLVTWTPASTTWIPTTSMVGGVGGTAWMAANGAARIASITNKPAAGGAANGGGPHNDSLVDMIGDGFWDGTGTPPQPDYAGYRYGCFTRRCHATNPHGADSSKYKLFASKLLFNEPADDDELGVGTYGGQDAVWDAFGATDASVERFVTNNSSIVSTTVAGDILIHGVAPDAAEAHALLSGLTCGRPSNPSTGEDECHAEASYAIVDKGIKENRNHGTGITGNDGTANVGNNNAYRTDNTGAEALGFGGNDHRDSKTGHVAGTFAAVAADGSYSPISGCTSCHDQTDAANTTDGHYTFPHGQSPLGATNLYMADGVTQATTGGDLSKTTAVRSRIWSGWSGSLTATKTITTTAPAGQKAYDGQCLKCHRDGAGAGIGLTE
jgi:predicted CXXCH cytochrome family protein